MSYIALPPLCDLRATQTLLHPELLVTNTAVRPIPKLYSGVVVFPSGITITTATCSCTGNAFGELVPSRNRRCFCGARAISSSTSPTIEIGYYQHVNSAGGTIGVVTIKFFHFAMSDNDDNLSSQSFGLNVISLSSSFCCSIPSRL